MPTDREIHVGTPADEFPLGESVTVHFHDFQNLTTVVDRRVESPTFSCAGYEWSLEICPGGDSISDTPGLVPVHLTSISPEDVVAKVEISVMTSSGDVHKTFHSSGETRFYCKGNFGYSKFMGKLRRGEIQYELNDILNKGTLTFVVRVKPAKEYYRQPTSVSAIHKLGENMHKLFGEENTADMAFRVQNSIFYCHRLILKVQAPYLFELAQNFDKDKPMSINDVKPETFELMLKYVYGKTIRPCEWKVHSQEFLKKSGKYGFSDLRSEAEGWYVKNMYLTVDNAVDELLVADGNHFLKIKDAVMEYIVENSKAVLASPSFPRLAGSTRLMTEVMMQLAESNESKKRKLDELSLSQH